MDAANSKRSDQAPDYPPSPLRIRGGIKSNLAQGLMLKTGDTIVAVNGISWVRLGCVARAVKALLERPDTPVVLTVKRGAHLFDVITTTEIKNEASRLSPERAENFKDIRLSPPSHNPRSLGNFAIYADLEGSADIIDLRMSLMAMVLPPLWFISRRLWDALGAIVCVLVTASVINLIFGLMIYVGMCLYVGRKQIPLIQAAMHRQGMYKVFVLAAPSEAAAQKVANQLYSQLNFRFSHPDDNTAGAVDIGLI